NNRDPSLQRGGRENGNVNFCQKEAAVISKLNSTQGPDKRTLSINMGLASPTISSPLINSPTIHRSDPEGEALLLTLEQTRRSEGDLRVSRARKWKRRARDQEGQSNPKGCSNTSIAKDVEKKRKVYNNGADFEMEGQYDGKKHCNEAARQRPEQEQ
ncbi:hypothetical protein U1Q18_027704, partial [Sarracenia purpurea var. burkii]